MCRIVQDSTRFGRANEDRTVSFRHSHPNFTCHSRIGRRAHIVLMTTVIVAQWLPAFAQAETAREIYTRRVMPLLESDAKSSCSECHFRGVELGDFLTRDPGETFAQLRGRGWIDIEQPEKSKLLDFLSRAPENGDPLIAKVRAAELTALREWITAAASEPSMLSAPVPSSKDLELPREFIRHARRDRVLASFSEAVWSQLARCVNCHSPDRNAKQVEKHGEQMSWIVPGNPAATLKVLTERELID